MIGFIFCMPLVLFEYVINYNINWKIYINNINRTLYVNESLRVRLFGVNWENFIKSYLWCIKSKVTQTFFIHLKLFNFYYVFYC